MDEFIVEELLKISKKLYVEAIDYIHAFLEENLLPPKLQNLFSAFKYQV